MKRQEREKKKSGSGREGGEAGRVRVQIIGGVVVSVRARTQIKKWKMEKAKEAGLDRRTEQGEKKMQGVQKVAETEVEELVRVQFR